MSAAHDYQPCATCSRPMKSNHTPPVPGVMSYGANGVCVSCYKRARRQNGIEPQHRRKRADLVADASAVSLALVARQIAVRARDEADRDELLSMLGIQEAAA